MSEAGAAAVAPDMPGVAGRLRTGGAGTCADRVEAMAASVSDGVIKSDTMSTWARTGQDARMVGVTIGQRYPDGSPVPYAATSVVATPTAAGTCDAMAVQVVPSPLPCAKLRDTLAQKGRPLGELAGLSVIGDGIVQTLLVPTLTNGCVLVGIRSDYAK